MSGHPTAFGRFVKWVVIPVIIAAIGYFLVGPHLGQDAKSKIKIPVIDKLIQPKVEPETTVTPPSEPPSEAPQVDISVRPADSSERSDRR